MNDAPRGGTVQTQIEVVFSKFPLWSLSLAQSRRWPDCCPKWLLCLCAPPSDRKLSRDGADSRKGPLSLETYDSMRHAVGASLWSASPSSCHAHHTTRFSCVSSRLRWGRDITCGRGFPRLELGSWRSHPPLVDRLDNNDDNRDNCRLTDWAACSVGVMSGGVSTDNHV